MLTLARYLEGRGSVKSLTRIEAEAFGVPYPLISGWPARHSTLVITAEMLDDLRARISSAHRATANRAKSGLIGLDALPNVSLACCQTNAPPRSAPRLATLPQSLNGFVLRKARRYGTRSKKLSR